MDKMATAHAATISVLTWKTSGRTDRLTLFTRTRTNVVWHSGHVYVLNLLDGALLSAAAPSHPSLCTNQQSYSLGWRRLSRSTKQVSWIGRNANATVRRLYTTSSANGLYPCLPGSRLHLFPLGFLPPPLTSSLSPRAHVR